MPLNETLTEVGNGLGNMFDGLSEPLGTLLIVIGLAGAVVALFMAIVNSITSSTVKPRTFKSTSYKDIIINKAVIEKKQNVPFNKDWYVVMGLGILLVLWYVLG